MAAQFDRGYLEANKERIAELKREVRQGEEQARGRQQQRQAANQPRDRKGSTNDGD